MKHVLAPTGPPHEILGLVAGPAALEEAKPGVVGVKTGPAADVAMAVTK